MIKFEGSLPITSPDQVSRGRDWKHASTLAQGAMAGVEGVVGSELFNNVDDPAGAGRGLVEQAARRLAEEHPPVRNVDGFVAEVLYYVDSTAAYVVPGFRGLATGGNA